ncbi:hypothetical protein AM587_10016903 [Phytophthora nicotianae]|uniref:HAT C-terminal dimerisation domain-containing protein n=2 Tax=Phytophthora nicotianae TaxID=4792 RepID=A0A0W8AY81_PHYNI|nr:hypothetical protein AM587_10016903 [Phytophthora nicotianae]
MKCAKVDCEWGEVLQTDPCSVCGRQVHHICSNDIYDGGELSKRPSYTTLCQKFLQVPNVTDTAADNILEEAKTLMRVEHRVFYKALNTNVLQQVEGSVAQPSGSPPGDGDSSSDTEAELLYGEEVSQPIEDSNAETFMNARADELLEEWLSLRVDWADVVRTQYPDEEESKKILSKVIVHSKKHNARVWNVEELCGRIDICRWFNEVGQAKYPSIAKLACVWLGWGCSTAFQKRVFSTGYFVMSKLRTKTDNERAQQQLILRHNRKEIRRIEESTRKV